MKNNDETRGNNSTIHCCVLKRIKKILFKQNYSLLNDIPKWVFIVLLLENF